MRGLPHAELLRLLSRLPILILSVPIISSFVAPINYLISAILSISLVGRSRILDSDRREGVVAQQARRGASGHTRWTQIRDTELQDCCRVVPQTSVTGWGKEKLYALCWLV